MKGSTSGSLNGNMKGSLIGSALAHLAQRGLPLVGDRLG